MKYVFYSRWESEDLGLHSFWQVGKGWTELENATRFESNKVKPPVEGGVFIGECFALNMGEECKR
jgi:hypothetical protein